jgi:hypothetical protein
MIFVLFPIKLRFFKNKFFIEQRRHLKHISDGEYMCDKISCLRSYFYNFLALLQFLENARFRIGIGSATLMVLVVSSAADNDVSCAYLGWSRYLRVAGWSGLNPAEVAETNGHSHLAKKLR